MANYDLWWLPNPIPLEHHNPNWANEFQTAKTDLESLLADLPILSIEHVGSTSIPDLIAKPVLDIDIVINAADFLPVLNRMREGGYTHLGECQLPGRHAFWQPNVSMKNGEPLKSFDVEREREIDDGMGGIRKMMVVEKIRERRRNTYVCFENSLSLKNHRDLKRVLMEDADLRKEYGERKVYLVNVLAVYNVEEYCMGKNQVVEKILRRAGWSDEDISIVSKTAYRF